nr:ribonuclease H-like domain-containing protein [Tanacetum cinerariifolium]
MEHSNTTAAKIPILDTGKFKQWKFRIQQCLQHEHYALWEVIEFGDSYEFPKNDAATGSASEGTATKKGRTVAVTTEDMQKKRNDVKARTTLLLALPDEHQLRFSKYKTAQELWAAILKTFGGNEATGKTKKNQLKQQYENFKAEGKETLEQTFNRPHAIVSQLEFMDAEIEQDDLNQKFLTSLPPEWLIGNKKVNTAGVPTASTQVSPASANVATASISLDTAYAYIASQSNGSQIKYKDINQIDEDDIEEMDIKAPKSQERGRRDNYRQGSKVEEQTPKALMAIDRVGWDWSYMANEEENHALVADEEAPTEFALMAKSGTDNEVFDNYLCSKACKKNTDSLNSQITELSENLGDTKNMLYHYQIGLSQVEGRLVEFKNQEVKFCEKIRGLELKGEFKTETIEYLTNKLELLKKEKKGLDSKLTGFQLASKNLDNLLESQRSDKNKEGLGYSDVPLSSFSSLLSSKKDMSWTGLPEFADDTITDYSRPSPAIESTSDDLQNKNPFVTETGASDSTILSKPEIKFVKPADSPTVVKTDKKETVRKPTVKYAELYRKSSKRSNVRGNQRNWNNLKSQQLGKNFEMKKACYNCGGFDHLSYDCRRWVDQGRTWAKNNYTHKSRSPRTVFHKTSRPPMRTNRPTMNAAQPKRTSFYKPAHSYHKRPFQRTTSGNSQINIDDKGYWDSGCSRHMIGNISYLSDFEPLDGGYVSFGQSGCKITGKGTIKTGKLEFENVYFVKDLKYNLFSMSQICDKNSVLFTDSECIVLGRNFKLTDDTNVLLRTPRQHNMYSIDLNNIVPHKDLTYLVAKASADECMLWHRRLGHLNIKTMNRLVRHTLVRGLPSKCFDNDHSCVAYLKGKQHKASCKTKLVNSVT